MFIKRHEDSSDEDEFAQLKYLKDEDSEVAEDLAAPLEAPPGVSDDKDDDDNDDSDANEDEDNNAEEDEAMSEVYEENDVEEESFEADDDANVSGENEDVSEDVDGENSQENEPDDQEASLEELRYQNNILLGASVSHTPLDWPPRNPALLPNTSHPTFATLPRRPRRLMYLFYVMLLYSILVFFSSCLY